MLPDSVTKVELVRYIVDRSPGLYFCDSYRQIMETWGDDTVIETAYQLREEEYLNLLSFVT